MSPYHRTVGLLAACIVALAVSVPGLGQSVDPKSAKPERRATVLKIEEGYIGAHGVYIYYKSFGSGPPLLILHGGPGASHDYFLPHLVPLAQRNRLVFIDERGSGKSAKLENTAGYTVENMVEDVEAVRQALHLGKMNLLGHSFGGVLAQAYALKHQKHLSHLVLCSTFHSTDQMNGVFRTIKAKMPVELRERINKMEAAGLYGHGKDYEKNRYPSAYMAAAWGEGYFPYLFQNRPDANFDPNAFGNFAWDVYRVMWGSNGEFVIDGNLTSVEYADRLPSIKVPTLITVGDHDECDASLSRQMHALIGGSKLVVLPKSGHMTFIDRPGLFIDAVQSFLTPGK
ncbi:MAG TPA: proline iminopeptidase-family hydrolase [Verrucomicrobiae bacterium]